MYFILFLISILISVTSTVGASQQPFMIASLMRPFSPISLSSRKKSRMSRQRAASILGKDKLIEVDDAVEAAFDVDKFAIIRIGGSSDQPMGRDASLWHYLPSLGSILRIFHLEYLETEHAKLQKCKALSVVLFKDALTKNANKYILFNREAALFAFFGGKYPRSMLAHYGLNLAQGVEEPREIAKTLGFAPHPCPIMYS